MTRADIPELTWTYELKATIISSAWVFVLLIGCAPEPRVIGQWEPCDLSQRCLIDPVDPTAWGTGGPNYAYPVFGYPVYGSQPHAGMEMTTGDGWIAWSR